MFIADTVLHMVQGPMPRLNFEEANGLQYAAGYIPRALRKKILRSKHKIKGDLLLCLQELLQEEDKDDTEDKDDAENNPAVDDLEQWVQLLDRGGLNRVTQSMYQLLVEMEYVTRVVLKGSLEACKQRAVDAIQSSESVRHNNWEMISEEWDQEDREVLFEMVVDLWVTIRGFLFTSDWIELYKIANKKSVQKSKGKRKELLATTAESKERKARKVKTETRVKNVKEKKDCENMKGKGEKTITQKNTGLIQLLLAKPS